MMAYASGAVVTSSGHHSTDRSASMTQMKQANFSGQKPLEVSNSMCYRSRGGSTVLSPSSPQCMRSVETPASLLDADLGNLPDFSYRDDRIQNDLLDEICSDIGIRDAIDLDFLDLDAVVGGNDKDLAADLDCQTTPLSRTHREFGPHGLSVDTCSSMMSPVSLAGDAACDSDRPQSNASADGATPTKGVRHYSNIQNLTRPTQRVKACATRRTQPATAARYALHDSPVTDNEKLRRQQSCESMGGGGGCGGGGEGPIELIHSQPSTPPHAAKRARVITSGDDLLAEVRECYAYVRGADMYASEPPSNVGSPDCMHGGGGSGGGGVGGGGGGYADMNGYQRAKTPSGEVHHGKENYFTPHGGMSANGPRSFYNDSTNGGGYPQMGGYVQGGSGGVRTARPPCQLPAMPAMGAHTNPAMNMSGGMKPLDMSARVSPHLSVAHQPSCHPTMPQRPYAGTTPYYGVPNGQYYPQQSNVPSNQQFCSGAGPAMASLRHTNSMNMQQRHPNVGTHVGHPAAAAAAPASFNGSHHQASFHQNYNMHASVPPQRMNNAAYANSPAGHPGAPTPSSGQQLLHRLMSSDESSVFRAHPLFPLLRDLIIADLNFHAPTFPFALIANLPADFDRLLHNYLSRNPPAAAAHQNAMYRTEAQQSVSNVIDEALRFAHRALIEKISARKRELGYRDAPKPLSAIEEFCERFDRAVKNTSDQSLCGDHTKLPGSTYAADSSPRRPSSSSPIPSMPRGGCASVGSSPLKSRPPVKSEDSTSCGRGTSGGETGVKNKVLPKEAVAAMLSWLRQHQDNPYPNDDEKEALIAQTRLTINQINYWFTNARRRILPKWTLQRYMDQQQQQQMPGGAAEHVYGGTALARM